MDKISIILTVYNKEEYLRECLDSLKKQTYPYYEVIIVDDGSTDESAIICKEYIRDNNNFYYYYQKNCGQNCARSLGLKKASADWILSVDADDFVSIDICEKLILAQRDNDADIVFGKVQKYQNGKYGKMLKSIEGVYTGIEAINHFIDEQFFSFGIPSGMYPVLYKKSILEEFFRSIDLRINFSEDCACTLYCLYKAQKACFISDIVYFYRQTPSSFCHVHKKSNVFSQKLLKLFLNQVFDKCEKYINPKLVHWLLIRDLLLGGYEFFSDYQGIYPYISKTCGNKIAIYGAGVFGEELYEKLPQKYVRVGWFDQDALYYRRCGKKVKEISQINEGDFDYILIAIIDVKVAQKVVVHLKDKIKDHNKILIISSQIIDSNYTSKKLDELDCI